MGIVGPKTTIQTAPGKLTIGDRTIGDTHDYGLLTVSEIVAKSSNIGTVKIALEMSPQTLWDMYTALGFGRAPAMGFPARHPDVFVRQKPGGRLNRPLLLTDTASACRSCSLCALIPRWPERVTLLT